MNTVIERIIREEVREYLSAYFGASKPAPRKRSYEPGPVQMHSPVIGNGLGAPQKKTMMSMVADMKTGESLSIKFDEFVDSYNKSESVNRRFGDRANWLADRFRGPQYILSKKYGREYKINKSEFEKNNTVSLMRVR